MTNHSIEISNNNHNNQTGNQTGNQDDKPKLTWENIQNYIFDNLTTFKTVLIVFVLIVIAWVYNQQNKASKVAHSVRSQRGGAKMMGAYSSVLSGAKGKMASVSPLSGAFSIVFSVINGIFMIIGIVLILILIPTLPIMVFMTISYYICRRKIWALRTL